MATSLNLVGQASANQRLVVSASRSTALAQDAAPSDVTISLRRPHLGERFGRAVANLFTLGWYTRNQNREQWAQFQKLAVAGQLQGASQNGLLVDGGGDESRDLSAQVRQAMAAYDGKRLTQARAANVLAELQRIREGDSPREKSPAMLDAKTHALARGWRSMKQLMRGLNETETGLRGYAQALKARRAPHDQSWKTEDSMLSILRPGRQISSHAIDEGQKALGDYASSKGVVFKSYGISNEICRNLPGVADSPEWQAVKDAAPGRALLAVPLRLEQPSLGSEPHSVLLAIDPAKKQILYLDAKSHSLAHAARHYGNVAGDLEESVKALGKRLFGEGWTADDGLLRLSLTKQQGANDCGAFTHTFSRLLIDGQSLGDIERTFTADDRKAMRGQMADDIRRHVLKDERPINEALAQERAGGANAAAPLTVAAGTQSAAPPIAPASGDDSFELT